MTPSNLTDAELIRLSEARDDLTELERELLQRLETQSFDLAELARIEDLESKLETARDRIDELEADLYDCQNEG